MACELSNSSAKKAVYKLYPTIIIIVSCITVELRIKDTLGLGVLSLVERLSSFLLQRIVLLEHLSMSFVERLFLYYVLFSEGGEI